MNTILIATSIAIFTSYIIYIIIKFGILETISTSFYRLPDKQKWMFIAWTWGSAVPLIAVGNSGLSFFAGGFLCFVGVASNTRWSNVTKVVHLVGAIGAIILGYAFLLYVLHLWLLVFISVMAGILIYLLNIKNNVWWIEVIAYYTIISGLILKQI